MDDSISRQQAIEELLSLNDQCNSVYYTKCIDDAVYALEILPSAKPEITETQVKEYCEKRCLVVLTSDAFHRLKQAEIMWHPQPEEKPKEAGEYFVVREGLESEPYYYKAIWGKNDWIDNHDENMKELTSYWYEYDSDWGYCIVADVIAWMPIPQYTKEKAESYLYEHTGETN